MTTIPVAINRVNPKTESKLARLIIFVFRILLQVSQTVYEVYTNACFLLTIEYTVNMRRPL